MKIDDRYVGLCPSPLLLGQPAVSLFSALSYSSLRTLGFQLVEIEPEDVIGYSVVYVPCGSPFSALTLPKAECMASAASRIKGVSFMVTVCLILSAMMNSLGSLPI